MAPNNHMTQMRDALEDSDIKRLAIVSEWDRECPFCDEALSVEEMHNLAKSALIALERLAWTPKPALAAQGPVVEWRRYGGEQEALIYGQFSVGQVWPTKSDWGATFNTWLEAKNLGTFPDESSAKSAVEAEIMRTLGMTEGK